MSSCAVCHRLSLRVARVHSERPRILVIDDSADTLLAMGEILDLEGYSCMIATSGEQGLEVAKRRVPDLILMDISMPGLNGLQTAQFLRADSKTREITIMAFTAISEENLRFRMRGDEFDAYCRKGHDVSHLIAVIKMLIP